MDIAHWLYKFASQAFLPVPVLLAVLLVGMFFYPRKRVIGVISISTAVLLLITLSLPVTARYLLYSLEQQYPATSIDAAPTADLILLLSGGVDLATAPRRHAELGARGDRVLTALRLLNAGKARQLLIAGKNSHSKPDTASEAESTIGILSEMGADPARMEVLVRGRNTRETATNLTTWVKDQRIDSVLLVTSAYHMPRSMALLKNLVPSVIPFSANHLITHGGKTSIFDWIPSAVSLSGSTLAINEYLGIWISRLISARS